MTLEFSTPALLFPTLSLIFLAYTNRFMSLAKLIRELHATYLEKPDENILLQIHNLRTRISLIQYMTTTGILSIFICVGCMFLIYSGYQTLAFYTFAVALIFMLISLGLSLFEINISTKALTLELSDIQDKINSGHNSFGQTLKNLNPLNRLRNNDAPDSGFEDE